jgi:hypothetical protein
VRNDDRIGVRHRGEGAGIEVVAVFVTDENQVGTRRPA